MEELDERTFLCGGEVGPYDDLLAGVARDEVNIVSVHGCL
jgi:hypothetical protein